MEICDAFDCQSAYLSDWLLETEPCGNIVVLLVQHILRAFDNCSVSLGIVDQNFMKNLNFGLVRLPQIANGTLRYKLLFEHVTRDSG